MNILSLNRKYTIEAEGMKFDISIPNPGQRAEIDIAVARKLNGVKHESVPEFTLSFIHAIETLNRVIVKYPDGFPAIKSWDEIDDFDFVEAVFSAYQEKYGLFEEELKKNRDSRSALINRNNPRPVSYEELSNTSKTGNESGGSGISSENVSSGGGKSSGRHGKNKGKDSNVQTDSGREEKGQEGIHAGVGQESPSSRRILN